MIQSPYVMTPLDTWTAIVRRLRSQPHNTMVAVTLTKPYRLVEWCPVRWSEGATLATADTRDELLDAIRAAGDYVDDGGLWTRRTIKTSTYRMAIAGRSTKVKGKGWRSLMASLHWERRRKN